MPTFLLQQFHTGAMWYFSQRCMRCTSVLTWSSIPSCVLVIERPWARINHITWRGFPGCSGIINGPLEMPLTQSTLGGVLGSTPSPALGSLAAVPLNYKCGISSRPHLGWDHPNISHHHSSLPPSFMGTVTGWSSCLYLAISSLHSSQCNLFFNPTLLSWNMHT